MRDTVGEPAVDGVYYYTIPKESLNGTVTISISSESVPQNDPEPQTETYTVHYAGEAQAFLATYPYLLARPFP